MTTEKEMMRRLHAIREHLYEKTKHMTPEERVNYYNRNIEEQLAKSGAPLKRSAIATM